jgi:LmbE family N-acetylglucosaminyl deacetylase
VAEHHQLDFADGGCQTVDPTVGAAAIRRVVTAVHPDTVVTFGPDGFTGHPDHVTVGEWTRHALADLGWAGRLLHPVLTAADRAAGRDIAEMFGVYTLGEPRICRPEELAARLELSGDLLAQKLAALHAHRSQTALLEEIIGIDRFAAWVRDESFVDAAPAG